MSGVDAMLTYPSYGPVAQEWAASVRVLCADHPRFDSRVVGRRGTLLWHNRQEITKQFLATDRQWNLMTDTDMLFSLEDVDALFTAAEENGEGVYSGTVMSLGPKGIKPIFGDWLPDKQTCRFWDEAPPPGPAVPIFIVPTAFLLVHRTVFEAIGDDGWFEHLRTTDGEKRVLGEDIAFCLRTLDAGFGVFLVPDCRPGHVKSCVIYPDGVREKEEP